MALKKTTVATAVSALAIASVMPGIAQADDPEYPPVPKSVSCKVRANANGNVLKVNMGPNMKKKSKFYTFAVQKQTAEGWVDVGTYKTKGRKETRRINLKRGTYQVVCNGKYGLTGATSNVQELLK